MGSAVRFARTRDGVAIAHRTEGLGPPLVICRGWITHLDSPSMNQPLAAFLDRLGTRFSVTRYDSRGNGMSERRLPRPPTWDDLLADLEAVVDDLGVDGVVLWGSSFGGPTAIRYAAAHPDRLRALVLDGTLADGRVLADSERSSAFLTLLTLAPVLPDAVFAALSFLTDPDPGMTHGHRVQMLRRSIDADLLAPLYGLLGEVDVRDEAAAIRVPTLVLHRARSRSVSVRAATELAKLVPGAQLVVLEGVAQNLWEEDPEAALAAMGEFLGVDLGPPAATAPTRLRGVMFTDIAGSTELTAALGDDAAQELVRTHDAIVRQALAEVGGAEVKHTGDGIMAWTWSTSDALRAAVAIQQALATSRHGLRVRIGVNAGEPIDEGGDLFGAVVQVASRACDAANPGQVLVTNVVKEMATGKGFRFTHAGPRQLKGVAEPVELWSLDVGL